MKKRIRLTLAASALSLMFASTASAAMIRQIYATSGSASINTSTWALSEGGTTYAAKTKPGIQSGMDRPVLSNGNIYMNIDSSWPADSNGMQKIFYEVIPGSNYSAPSVKNPQTQYVEFRFKFDPEWDIVTAGGAPTGTGIFQSWQGSGWPPIQMRTEEDNGTIKAYFLMSNDDCRGSLNSNSAKIFTGSYQRGQWYTIKIEYKFGYNGGGYVKVWKDGSLKVDWTGKFGYKPASLGGQTGTPDGASVEVGMYQKDIPGDVTKKIGFDYIKYWK